VPGDQLTLHATTIKHRPKLAEVQCTATVDGQTAAEARLKFMLVDKEFDPR
jgi:3-hydroxymyristoyl/3-hydroxydecanoyl-(acyl carrier protein) dehydratase